MTTRYKVQGKLLLTPVWHNDPPLACVQIGHSAWTVQLEQPRWFEFDFDTDRAQETISVDFLNKHNQDTVPELNLDKAIVVDQIEFFGLQDPKFVWAGIYKPHYPEPWASQQSNLNPILTNHNYLSWNGQWRLTFDVPVFTWIHKIQSLGWIYS